MSELTINIIDNSRTISSCAHGSYANELVASLTAEPRTIEELQAAMCRFHPADSDFDPFGFFYDGYDPEPYDSGILVIDLETRIVAVDTSYSRFSREGTVTIRTDDEGDFPMPYKLSGDWEFVATVAEYEGLREERAGVAEDDPIDARAVLYGEPLFEFILAEKAANAANDHEDLLVDVHARWLTTERADLGGRSPRDSMLERNDFIVADLHSRQLQWAFTKVCPPPIPTDSDAFRFAGFGTNEIVIYYDLVRNLLTAAFSGAAADADELRGICENWLNQEQAEFSGRRPADIIETERSRVNLTVSPIECMIDEDCEICQMLAADFDNPMFWGLDGSGMEPDRFEFSFFKTRQEFDEDRRRFEEFNLEFERRYMNESRRQRSVGS